MIRVLFTLELCVYLPLSLSLFTNCCNFMAHQHKSVVTPWLTNIIIVFYLEKFVCLSRITNINQLWRDICFGRDNHNCLLYEGNNSSRCIEVAIIPQEFTFFYSRLSVLNDVSYHFWMIYLLVVFSDWCSSILVCTSCLSVWLHSLGRGLGSEKSFLNDPTL